jgi:hypothetical protein
MVQVCSNTVELFSSEGFLKLLFLFQLLLFVLTQLNPELLILLLQEQKVLLSSLKFMEIFSLVVASEEFLDEDGLV